MSVVADRRSVGELLVETDLASRRLLHEAHHLDAAAAVRTWPELVQAAHELLDILPRPSQPTPGTEAPRPQGDLTGERLHLMATTLHRQLQSRAWPEPGPAHPDLEAMTANLVRAHDLIHRHLPAPVNPSRAVLADADAARTRTLHTLYLTSHALGLAVRARERDLATSRSPRARHVTNQRAALRHVHSRLAAFELVAGVEVYRHYPAALTGEHRDRANPERLPLALAAWDLAAHRALAQDPHLPTLVHVTRTQSAVTAMSRAVLEAAAAHHRVDPDTVTAQLRPQLAATEAAWGTLHSILADLNARGPRPVRPDLGAAGSEVVAAFSELVLDGTTLAAAAHVSDRTSTASLQAVTDALAAGNDLTALVADTAADPALTAHAGRRSADPAPPRRRTRLRSRRQPRRRLGRPRRPRHRAPRRPPRPRPRHHRPVHPRAPQRRHQPLPCIRDHPHPPRPRTGRERQYGAAGQPAGPATTADALACSRGGPLHVTATAPDATRGPRPSRPRTPEDATP